MQPNLSASTKPSPAKSAVKRVKSSEEGGFVNLVILANVSTYLDPFFLQSAANAILLPANRKRLSNIRPIYAAEWGITHLFQVTLNLDIVVLKFLSMECNLSLSLVGFSWLHSFEANCDRVGEVKYKSSSGECHPEDVECLAALQGRGPRKEGRGA